MLRECHAPHAHLLQVVQLHMRVPAVCGCCVCVLQGILGSVNDVSFTSDGRRLVGAGGDKRLLVWNTATGQVGEAACSTKNRVF